MGSNKSTVIAYSGDSEINVSMDDQQLLAVQCIEDLTLTMKPVAGDKAIAFFAICDGIEAA